MLGVHRMAGGSENGKDPETQEQTLLWGVGGEAEITNVVQYKVHCL